MLYSVPGCKSLYENAEYWKKFNIVDDAVADGIEDVTTVPDAIVTDIYDANGKALPALRPGINIIRYSDGTTRKVMEKR